MCIRDRLSVFCFTITVNAQGNEKSIVLEGHYQGKNLYVQNPFSFQHTTNYNLLLSYVACSLSRNVIICPNHVGFSILLDTHPQCFVVEINVRKDFAFSNKNIYNYIAKEICLRFLNTSTNNGIS